MNEGDIETCLDRIDAALARIEASAHRPASTAKLAQRHERLRRATAAAVAELDTVIRRGA